MRVRQVGPLARTVGGIVAAVAGAAALTAATETATANGAAAASARPSPASAISEAWSRDLPDTGAPVALSSPNVDDKVPGGPAIVVGDRAGNLYALSERSGRQLWSLNVGQPIDAPPSVDPSTGTIYVGTGDAASPVGGGYLAVTPAGVRSWYQPGTNPATDPYPDSGVAAGMTVGTLQGRRAVEAGNLGQETYAMDVSSGSELGGFPWFSADSVFSTASLDDLYGNGSEELVSGGDSTAGVAYGKTYQNGGHVRILSDTGQLVCEHDTTQNIDRSSPAVGPFLGGQVGIAIGTGQFYPGASDSDKVIALDDQCGVAWEASLDGTTQSSPALADVLGNGQLQVVEGSNIGGDFDSGGTVYVLNGSDGQVAWSRPAATAIVGSITTADLFGQGYQDLLVPTLDGVQILDGRTGALVDTLASLEGFQNAPLVTADADGSMGITVAGYNGYNQGVVDHFAVAGSNGAMVHENDAWPQFHHDPQLTGTSTYTASRVDASVGSSETTTGTPVTYSATVSSPAPGPPIGTVAFSTGSTTLCTATLASGSGSCSSAAAPVGIQTVSAVYSGDGNDGSGTGTTTLAVVAQPGVYRPLVPLRICDTRAGNPSGLSGPAAQCAGRTLGAGSTLPVEVAGAFGVPARNVTAAVLNVTSSGSGAPGYFTVFPAGATRPTASNLSYGPGQVVSNLVEVGVGAGGAVSLYSSAASDAVVDLEGYVTTAGRGGAGLYEALPSPVRICDTRGANPSGLTPPDTQCNRDVAPGGADRPVTPAAALTVSVDGHGGVPTSGVSAVALNVTVVDPAAAGYVTAYPAGRAEPTAANLTFAPGQVVAGRVIVPVNGAGRVSLYASVPTDVVVDVSGYYTAAGGTAGAEFTPDPAPQRICDTRGSNPSDLAPPDTQCDTDVAPGGPGNPLGAAGTRGLQATGLGYVPSGAGAVVMNVTVVQPSAPDYLTVFPEGSPQPTTSDLNAPAGGTAANLVMATLSGAGGFDVYNSAGRADLVVDVAGWYSAAGPTSGRPADR